MSQGSMRRTVASCAGTSCTRCSQRGPGADPHGGQDFMSDQEDKVLVQSPQAMPFAVNLKLALFLKKRLAPHNYESFKRMVQNLVLMPEQMDDDHLFMHLKELCGPHVWQDVATYFNEGNMEAEPLVFGGDPNPAPQHQTHLVGRTGADFQSHQQQGGVQRNPGRCHICANGRHAPPQSVQGAHPMGTYPLSRQNDPRDAVDAGGSGTRWQARQAGQRVRISSEVMANVRGMSTAELQAKGTAARNFLEQFKEERKSYPKRRITEREVEQYQQAVELYEACCLRQEELQSVGSADAKGIVAGARGPGCPAAFELLKQRMLPAAFMQFVDLWQALKAGALEEHRFMIELETLCGPELFQEAIHLYNSN